jgi:hypothetical protein
MLLYLQNTSNPLKQHASKDALKLLMTEYYETTHFLPNVGFRVLIFLNFKKVSLVSMKFPSE